MSEIKRIAVSFTAVLDMEKLRAERKQYPLLIGGDDPSQWDMKELGTVLDVDSVGPEAQLDDSFCLGQITNLTIRTLATER